MVHFGPPGSGSVFPMRIRIQPTKMNADPCGSGSRCGSATPLFSIPVACLSQNFCNLSCLPLPVSPLFPSTVRSFWAILSHILPLSVLICLANFRLPVQIFFFILPVSYTPGFSFLLIINFSWFSLRPFSSFYWVRSVWSFSLLSLIPFYVSTYRYGVLW